MHGDKAGIADFHAAVAVDHGMGADEDIATETDGTTEGMEDHTGFQPSGRADFYSPALLAEAKTTIDAATELTGLGEIDPREAKPENED